MILLFLIPYFLIPNDAFLIEWNECQSDQCKANALASTRDWYRGANNRFDLQFELYTAYVEGQYESQQLKSLLEAKMISGWDYWRAKWESMGFYERLESSASSWWNSVKTTGDANRFMFILEVSTLGGLVQDDPFYGKYVDRYKELIGENIDGKSEGIIPVNNIFVEYEDVAHFREAYYFSKDSIAFELGIVNVEDFTVTRCIEMLKALIITGQNYWPGLKSLRQRLNTYLWDSNSYKL